MRLYTTKRVGEEVDKYLMVKITRILAEKEYEKDTNYLQVFTIANNEIVVEQEQPAKKEHYKISREYEKQKLFAIKDKDQNNQEVWTVLFPDEY